MEESNKYDSENEYTSSLENPSPQTHKLKISYIINEPNAPTKKFGGIFKHTAVDIDTGIQYYNFLETEDFAELNKIMHDNNNTNSNCINNNNCTLIITSSEKLIKRKKLAVKLNYKYIHLMNKETKKFIINKILLRKIY